MSSCTKKLIFAAIGILLLILAMFRLTSSHAVVASMHLPDGAEYMIVQNGADWAPEGYNIAFYMRPAGGKWGWCYIDHQANRWRDVAMTYDPMADVVTVTKRGIWQAALDRKHGIFAIGDGAPRREVAAPQDYREPELASR